MSEKEKIITDNTGSGICDEFRRSAGANENLKVMLLENIHPAAAEILKGAGFSVETAASSMTEDELSERIKDISVLGVRSRTRVTERVLEKADKLLVTGVFGIGVNNVDLRAATMKGVAVFNAPFSSARSVVELVVGEMIMLMRRVTDKSVKMHSGIWDKSSAGSREIRGKTLGIAGYGNIGAQLSVIAESLGMRVLYYDTEEKMAMGNAAKCRTMNELLENSDVLSMHIDGRDSNKNLIGSSEFELMKDGVILINLSRGSVVDIKALRENILRGKVGGCAIDVFPDEPEENRGEFKTILAGLPNTILTPHVGGSTEEAQMNIGLFVPGKIRDFICTGSTANSVNLPNITLPKSGDSHRLVHIHRNIPGILAAINRVLADHGINITGQSLKTNDLAGYVITDINSECGEDLLRDISSIENTIKCRVLY